ncbi:MAG: hypothetical protein HYZ74_03575 [Elusimicrobia bacterium]|nr:hypothetical protein [Elusimicrobiota bacterium]
MELRSRRALRTLLAVAALLTAISAANWICAMAWNIRVPGLVGEGCVTNINNERGLANWFSLLQLAAAALLLWMVAAREARCGSRDALAWRALSAGFALLSLEELAGLHDRVGKALHAHWHLTGWWRFSWVVAALVFLPPLGLAFIGLLRRLEPRRRRQFIVAGAIYLSGMLGLEIIGGKIYAAAGDVETPLCVLLFHVEELLEMTGIALFLSALIEHLAGLERTGPVARFVDESTKAA